MVQWRSEGSRFECIELDLGPDEQRVIAVFQDESCFHVNDNKQTSWCVPSSQFPQDIIFTPSDRNGHLIVARCITYPRSGGDL